MVTPFQVAACLCLLLGGVVAQCPNSCVIPEVVRTDADGYKSMQYSGIIPYAVEALKLHDATQAQLQEENKAQGATIEAQGATIAAQGATIEAQGATIAAQGATIAHLQKEMDKNKAHLQKEIDELRALLIAQSRKLAAKE